MSEPILVTCALPYANGSIHLGHLVEYLLADFYVRYLRMTGADAVYLCADDTHGTPIEIKARQLGVDPEQLIRDAQTEHVRDFAAFQIRFDEYYTTHSEENRRHAEAIFAALRERGHVVTRPVEQYYCERDGRFLPDRFLRGVCPRCGAADQYGDVCEKCNASFPSIELVDARCALCGSAPVRRVSEHYFFLLGEYAAFLREWASAPGRLQPGIRNFVERWLDEGLRDWDISRDGPYFGFRIPGEQDKYFYVWLDAPVGYIATTERFCARTGRDFDAYWRGGARIEHVIGKDIVYFHTLFWPAMLHGAGYTLPERVFVHGFLTVGGEKMSKSRGTFINARTYLEQLDPSYLRYYFAAKLGSGTEDIDFSPVEFVDRVNADLVNKIVNLASRSLSFINKRLEGRLAGERATRALLAAAGLDDVERRIEAIGAAYAERESARAVRGVIELAEAGNQFLQEQAPWAALDEDPERARAICTVAINLVQVIAVTLAPVLPELTGRLRAVLHPADPEREWRWDDARIDLFERPVGPFTRLLDRLEDDAVERLIEASRAEHGAA